jgi:hypothetical protein
VTVTVDDTNNRTDIDCDNPVWTGTAGNATGAIVICYKPDTGSADSAIIPLFIDAFVATPGGQDITYVVASSGFCRVS